LSEIETAYLSSGEHQAYLLNSGLISQEEYKRRLIQISK
jgi:hypothetical protein